MCVRLRRASLFFFFARIVALLQTTSDNIIRNGGEGLMLTFENILELFQEYLLRDPEEEVLPCKRGYVRLTWNKDSRYCVDGILCRTPEELFDILLSDFQDFCHDLPDTGTPGGHRGG